MPWAEQKPVFEYIVMEDIGPLNWSQYHPNGIITWGTPNGVVRYCVFRKGPHGSVARRVFRAGRGFDRVADLRQPVL
jgi:hypothetical protein